MFTRISLWPKLLACVAATLTLCLAAMASAQTTAPVAVAFDDYFVNKALRLELYQIGDAREELITLHQVYEESVWPENPRALIPPFEAGHYAIKVYDAASDRLIFAKEFDTMYGEYKTTTPAINGVKRVFQKSVRLPEPKKPVRVTFERRDKKLVLSPEFTTTIDPADYHIIRENVNQGDWTFEVQKTGDPHDRVDIAFVSEGYTEADKDKFKADVEKFTKFCFSVEPYKSAQGRFNIYGVFRASVDRAMDEPRQRAYKSTVLNASYNSFDLDRYLLTEEDHTLHRIAAQVPYDTVVVLVNSARYGGGSICLDYCIASADNATGQHIFVHEFGHSFAALADEYVGTVAYNDMYPAGVEPLEPNITELLDPANIKWKAFLTPGIALPTRDGRAEIQDLQRQLQTVQREVADASAAAKAKGQTDAEIQAIQDQNAARQQELQAKLTQARAYSSSLGTKVGAFEGAGYLSKGMYRPQLQCWMGNGGEGFCVVCQAGIRRVIDYYAPAAQPARQAP
jgi:hypothetical protein